MSPAGWYFSSHQEITTTHGHSVNPSFMTTAAVVKTFFEQSVWSPKIHRSFAEPRCGFHRFHAPKLQRQLGETFIDYLHLTLWFCLMDCLRGIFQNTRSPHLHAQWYRSFRFSYWKKKQYSDAAHSSGKYSAVISTCESQFARCDSLSDFCSPCRQMSFLSLRSFENMHFVILRPLCAAFATLPQLLHNNALCSSFAEEPTVTNSSGVADGMLISKMPLPFLSTGSTSVTCRVGPCSTEHSFEQSA